MAEKIDITVTVYRITRAPSSNQGNPRYTFHTSLGRFKTSPNLGAAYALENTFKINETIDQETTLTLNGYGNITNWSN